LLYKQVVDFLIILNFGVAEAVAYQSVRITWAEEAWLESALYCNTQAPWREWGAREQYFHLY